MVISPKTSGLLCFPEMVASASIIPPKAISLGKVTNLLIREMGISLKVNFPKRVSPPALPDMITLGFKAVSGLEGVALSGRLLGRGWGKSITDQRLVVDVIIQFLYLFRCIELPSIK